MSDMSWLRALGRRIAGWQIPTRCRHVWPPYPDRWWLYECFTLTCEVCGKQLQIDEPVQRMY